LPGKGNKVDILSYTEEHRIFRESFRSFLQREIIPYVEAWEEAGHVPPKASVRGPVRKPYIKDKLGLAVRKELDRSE
jgi:hypothetical protein